MSRMTSQYPERVFSSSDEGKMQQMARALGGKKRSAGWMLAGLAGVGLVAWMAWHFGPDLQRYIKMERM